MLTISVQHAEMVLGVIGAVAGVSILISSHVNTRALRQAVPVLVGAASWVLVFTLGASALAKIKLLGHLVPEHNYWEFFWLKVLTLVYWLDYLRLMAKTFDATGKDHED